MERVDRERRGFFVGAIYGLWALIAAGLSGTAAAYLFFPARAQREEAWIEVAEVEELTPGIPEEVVFRRNRIDGWKVTSERSSAWVVKEDEARLAAFRPQCTHLGCAYHFDRANNEFLCPCHTSTFGLDGRVLSGPAPRPLDRYPIKVEGGRLLLGMPEPAAGQA